MTGAQQVLVGKQIYLLGAPCTPLIAWVAAGHQCLKKVELHPTVVGFFARFTVTSCGDTDSFFVPRRESRVREVLEHEN